MYTLMSKHMNMVHVNTFWQRNLLIESQHDSNIFDLANLFKILFFFLKSEIIETVNSREEMYDYQNATHQKIVKNVNKCQRAFSVTFGSGE